MKTKILFVLSLLFGLMFINSGLDKFFHYMPMPKDIPANVVRVGYAILEIGWLMPLVAVAEIAGGLLITIPRFRALGALVILPVMVGILLMHIVHAPAGLPIALVLFAILLWIMIDNRAKYRPLVSKNQ